MAVPTRITGPLLIVLEILLRAAEEKRELHGWAIKKEAGLSGATTYKMFDRLEDAGWITGRWEPSDDPGKPPRRYYRLTPTGEPAARALLAERKPDALHRTTKLRHVPVPRSLPGLFTALGRRLSGGER